MNRMEFKFNIKPLFPGRNKVCMINSSLEVINLDDSEKDRDSWNLRASNSIDLCNGKHRRNKSNNAEFPSPNLKQSKNEMLSEIINKIGAASSFSQGLQKPITSFEKLLGTDHKLYVLKDDSPSNGSILGILKVGRKQLFVVDKADKYHKCLVLCVLDFYVHESKQRMGFGKQLFQAMLSVEKIKPQKLAIDRPSSKFTDFLQKHYDLKDALPQSNNFIVFKEFFDNNPESNISIQRHSFSGIESKHFASPSHPRSVYGNSQNNLLVQDRIESDEVLKNGPSSIKSPLSDVVTNHCRKLSKQENSSSWNLFGISSPVYATANIKK